VSKGKCKELGCIDKADAIDMGYIKSSLLLYIIITLNRCDPDAYYMCSLAHLYIPSPAPGNFESKLLSYLAICGHPSVARIGFSASLNFETASTTFPSKPVRISGAAELTAWKAKHMALLPSRSVSVLKTLPVRSAMLRPVKVLGEPVLPPTTAMYGSALSAPRASTVKATRP
jgi:hypothetical protein